MKTMMIKKIMKMGAMRMTKMIRNAADNRFNDDQAQGQSNGEPRLLSV